MAIKLSGRLIRKAAFLRRFDDLDIRELLQAQPEERLQDVMTTNLVTLNGRTAVKDAAKLFVRYSFRAIPIVDDEGVMIGAIPYRDVMNLQPMA